jgi:hypothetical protein
MRPLLARSAVALGAAVAAAGMAAAPAYAAGAATVTAECTQFGTALLPANAPPVKGGIITVEVNGQIITTQAVPGPCNAPGFVKVMLGG